MPEMMESASPRDSISTAWSRESVGRNSMSGKALMASLAVGFLSDSGKMIFMRLL